MDNTSISLVNQFPKNQYTLLIPIETVAKISEIQSPVINAVSISTNLEDKEIYEQEKYKAKYTDKNNFFHPEQPARYALTKRGLTKLAEAAGIKQVDSQPVLPSTCQKCAEVNRMSRTIIACGQCKNRDVKYKVTISVPQLTGETLYFMDHHEINVELATAGMSDKQKTEFLKHLTQICEAKALNGAIRTALQIKGTYTIEELKKPFVVAYLVPNLDNPDVKRVAIESMFASMKNLFGNQGVFEQQVIETENKGEENAGYNDVYIEQDMLDNQQEYQEKKTVASEQVKEDRTRDFCCDKCGEVVLRKVWDYSVKHYEHPLCYKCQKLEPKVG